MNDVRIIPHLRFNPHMELGHQLNKIQASLERLEAKIIETVKVVNDLDKQVRDLEKWDSSHM